ncbi:MAG: translation elongation factor 4 [Patescibacteria group bacterium UBA2103]
MEEIRNFSIIAHIDHGKSTLADRLLERTGTITQREMKDQVLDQMDLERERGITIKMQPARMKYEKDGVSYIINLIDTPGHIDFAYEVSRALKAVEGVVLLVDSTQGVQAQTLSTLAMAREQGCVIIPVLSKIDSPYARIDEISDEIVRLIDCSKEDIIHTSGKTGEGSEDLLNALIERVPAPENREANEPRALIFDFDYSNHRGIILYTRLFDGKVKKGDQLYFKQAGKGFIAQEVGVFTPKETPADSLEVGEIGYIVTGIKEPGVVNVGDTVGKKDGKLESLAGYKEASPVVWASVYPESQDDLPLLRQALERLQLTDSSISFEEEASGVLGRGFRCGFLGMLHLEIITERLRREFNLALIVTMPTITYEVTNKKGEAITVYTPSKFPEHGDVASVSEPWVLITLITTPETIDNILKLLYEHEAAVGATETFGDGRMEILAEMPLRELMRGFFDRVKSVSSGYASLSYEMLEMRNADVVRLDVLVAEEVVPAFTRIVSRRRAQEDAEKLVEKLHEILPRQQFVTKIQAQAMGRVLSSKSLSALRKDVTGHLYGGDITRKRKLLEKQKKGKKKALANAKVDIPEEVFMKMIKSDS